MGKSPEFATELSCYHPNNQDEKQFGLVYQPLDEIRDYFGDHIALYFAWLGHYTRALIFPTAFGVCANCAMALGRTLRHGCAVLQSRNRPF
jgi:hypothetical protein